MKNNIPKEYQEMFDILETIKCSGWLDGMLPSKIQQRITDIINNIYARKENEKQTKL